MPKRSSARQLWSEAKAHDLLKAWRTLSARWLPGCAATANRLRYFRSVAQMAEEDAMARKPNVWVTGNRREGYEVRSEGATRAAAKHGTQGAAEKAAQEIAKNRGVEVIVQRPNGQIRSRDSFGSDPNPPRDREH